MSLPRKDMRQYDELALDPKNWPLKAVEVRENPDKDSRVPYIFYTKDGEPLCSSKRAGWTPEKPLYCGGEMLGAGGRCKMHGGVNTTIGPANNNFKHGRYSKSLPTRLADRYEESENDPELMSLREEVRLIDAKVSDLLMTAHEGGAHTIFKDISKAWRQFDYAVKDQDKQKIADAKRAMEASLKMGLNEALVWEQINKLVDMRRKMVLAEGKRQQMLDQFLTVEQVNILLAGALAIIAREVSDRATVAKVVTEFGKLTGERGKAALPKGNVIEVEYESNE